MQADGSDRAPARPRLKDVAALAGVSIKTVSNVVNGYPHVTPTTRLRVERALGELNYRPNLSARNLRRGRSGIVALAIPELGIPYFAELAEHVIRAAARFEWTVLVDQTGGDPERELDVAAGLLSLTIDGLILSPLALGYRELAHREVDTPLVLLGERTAAGTADHVAIDNVAAARAATEHLLSLGRRRIAAIGVQPAVPPGTGLFRLQGYAEALRAAGLEPAPELLMPAPRYHRADGADAMQRLLELDDPPDAVFCFNDLLALGALRALLAAGVRVPDEMAVVGFDGVEETAYSTPSLTTIAPDKEQIAATAVRLLHDRVERESDAAPQDVRAPFMLVARESTLGR
jgi:DNA-binding LacI/PurR family transcriptional regulator